VKALKAHIDFETGNTTDIKFGVYKYVESVNARVWLFSWRIGSKGPVSRYHPGDPAPLALLEHIRSGGIVAAHNATFERLVWNNLLIPRYNLNWPQLKAEQMTCSVVKALSLGLPGKLDKLGDVLGSYARKSRTGTAHMRTMATPKIDKTGALVWKNSPTDIQMLGEYCDTDVETETDIDDMLPDITGAERQLWLLDQTINDTGVLFDVELVTEAVALIAYARKKAAAEIDVLTGGAVTKLTTPKIAHAWFKARGYATTGLTKAEVLQIEKEAKDIGDTTAVEVAKLWRLSSKTSLSKYDKILDCVNADGRGRGLMQFYGASTGRWAGRAIQPHNFYRMDTKVDVPKAFELMRVLSYKGVSLEDKYKLLLTIDPSPLTLFAKSIRAFIKADTDHVLIGGDFSNIEGRINAWLARETAKLHAFSMFDLGLGSDLYIKAYSCAFGIPEADVTEPLRQIGKVMELALGYQGGVGAFISMMATYNIVLADIVKAVKATVSGIHWNAQADKYASASDKLGLDIDEWTAVKIVVVSWRQTHSKITQSWWNLGDAVVTAVSNPGTIVKVEDYPVSYVASDGFLWCRLPNGRMLAYANPRVKETKTDIIIFKDGTRKDADNFLPHEIELIVSMGLGVLKEGTIRKQVICDGRDGANWTSYALYGGFLCENIVQAVARDVMAEAMFRVYRAGYKIILTVHDELLSEVWKTFGSVANYRALMQTKSAWLTDLPLAASTWSNTNYVK
jgi:DNA polymerase bacteriophage-type